MSAFLNSAYNACSVSPNAMTIVQLSGIPLPCVDCFNTIGCPVVSRLTFSRDKPSISISPSSVVARPIIICRLRTFPSLTPCPYTADNVARCYALACCHLLLLRRTKRGHLSLIQRLCALWSFCYPIAGLPTLTSSFFQAFLVVITPLAYFFHELL